MAHKIIEGFAYGVPVIVKNFKEEDPTLSEDIKADLFSVMIGLKWLLKLYLHLLIQD